MISRNVSFSIRRFLRDRQALLVHFSTAMPRNPKLSFPFDLLRAKKLRNVVLSFSTIMSQDIGPYQNDVHPEDSNAQGSIGIVVDIPADDCVVAVGPADHGSFYDVNTHEVEHIGSPPDAEACTRSIVERRTSNEWQVGDFEFIGIFIFLPAIAFRRLSDDVVIEVPIGLDAVLAEFPEDRILSSRAGQFVEYDRATRVWVPCDYKSIMPDKIVLRPNQQGNVHTHDRANTWIQ